ncbi:hypothetical protein K490DRAFT_58309 [Saccharata proteae CBS 121410]|uniref:Uncharacterized protein n=1 Tax=Saccharata proteae CBS 121410 TaxID=1314787 RepID=A0A9P4LW30_9PEZI|nr:hypothetical protein K490DRAFT_58309 [Saccharata proteae CBS 121410]
MQPKKTANCLRKKYSFITVLFTQDQTFRSFMMFRMATLEYLRVQIKKALSDKYGKSLRIESLPELVKSSNRNIVATETVAKVETPQTPETRKELMAKESCESLKREILILKRLLGKARNEMETKFSADYEKILVSEALKIQKGIHNSETI